MGVDTVDMAGPREGDVGDFWRSAPASGDRRSPQLGHRSRSPEPETCGVLTNTVIFSAVNSVTDGPEPEVRNISTMSDEERSNDGWVWRARACGRVLVRCLARHSKFETRIAGHAQPAPWSPEHGVRGWSARARAHARGGSARRGRADGLEARRAPHAGIATME